jgi:hypothetical protein
VSAFTVGQVGDWIEEPSSDGSPRRRGLITKVLGSGAHTHYRVRWDEEHESIHFPSASMRIRRVDAASRTTTD